MKALEGKTEINFFHNKIGDEGAKTLGNALGHKVTITIIDHDQNNISDEGAKALATTIESNNTITDISLYQK